MLKTIMMSSIVGISRTFASRCNIRRSYYLADDNSAKLGSFFLAEPGLEIIRKIFEGILGSRSARMNLIWGAPGVGKSHLGLVLANLFGRELQEEKVAHLMSQIHERDPIAFKLIQRARKRMPKVLTIFPEAIAAGEGRFRGPLMIALNGALYQEGLEYIPRSEGTLREIFSGTTDFLRTTTSFRGLLFIFDDFDRFLSILSENPTHPDVVTFGEFVEILRRSQFPIFFIGICSRNPRLYFEGKEHEMEELFDAIYYLHPFGREGEFEELVASRALIHPVRDEWKELSGHEDFGEIEKSLHGFGLYTGLSGEVLLQKILLPIYPMHPLACYCLPRMAVRMSTADRNVSTFFADSSPGGLRYFIENFAIIQPSGRLSLYTSDYLFSYFEKNLKEDRTYSGYAEILERFYTLAGDVPNSRRILRLILTLQIINSTKLRPRKAVILESFHVGTRETKQIGESLNMLLGKGALEFDNTTKEFRIPGEIKVPSFEEVFSKTKEQVRSIWEPAEFLNRYYRPHFIPAADYNKRFFADRYACGRFIMPAQLKNTKKLLQEVEDLFDPARSYSPGDAIVLYCPVSSQQEMPIIQEALKGELMSAPSFILAIPKRVVDFVNEVFEIKALEILKQQEPAISESDSDFQIKAARLLRKLRKSIKTKVTEFLRSDGLNWYREGKVLKDLPAGSEGKYISKVMQDLFHKAPLIKYRTLLTRRALKGSTKAIKEAVDLLLLTRGPIPIRKDGASIGEVILRVALVEKGVMEKVGERKDTDLYEVRRELPHSSAFYDFWNAAIERFLKNGRGRKIARPEDLIREYLKPPHGFSQGLIVVLLAAFLRRGTHRMDMFSNYRELLRNPALLKKEETSYESLARLVADPEDWAMIFYEYTEQEEEYLPRLIKIFAPEKEIPQEVSLWEEAKRCIQAWYEKLPMLTRRSRAFSKDFVYPFLMLLQDEDKKKDPRKFLRLHLLEAMQFDVNDFSWRSELPTLLARIGTAVGELAGFAPNYREAVLGRIIEVFCKGEYEGEFEESVGKWLRLVQEGIDPEELNEDHLVMLQSFREKENLEEVFLIDLPTRLGYGPVSEWVDDRAGEYVSRLHRAKLEMENRRFEKFYPVPENEEEKMEKLDHFIETVMESLNLPLQEKERLLEETLESFATALEVQRQHQLHIPGMVVPQ